VARRRSDDGISLIEVMVAFTILLITVVPLTYLLTSAISSAADARQRQAALQLADSWLEVLSNSSLPTTNGAIITNQPQNPATWISATTTQIPKSTLAGTAFAVTANFTTQSVNNQGQSDLCSSGQPPSPSHPAVILLQVTVSWNHGNSSVSDTTAVNYPQPGLQTQGFLSVQLSNSGSLDVSGNVATDRLEAVPVNLTETAQGSGSDPWVSASHTLTVYPDENGCVFAQVPTGSYNVSVSQPTSGKPTTFTGYGGTPPFVTTSGSTADTASTTVTVTAESTVQLTAFDEGITSSITYGSSAAVDGGVTCPGTTTLTCVSTGNGTAGATAAWGGTGSTWSQTTFSGITNLSPVACTSGGSPTCVGVGYNASGAVIRTTSSDLGTTSTDTAPAGVTDISQVACPSTNGCYALGTTAAGPVLLAGAVGQTAPQHDTWAVVAPAATTFTNLSSLACPTTSTCELSGSATVGLIPSAPTILRLDGDPATLATNATWSPTFTADTLPPQVTSAGKITCPTTTLCEAIAAGDATSTTDPTVLTAVVSATPGTTWTIEPSFPTGNTAVNDISCTSTTCVAVGSAAGNAAIWTADLTQAPHDWSAATTVPASVSAVSSVACGLPSSGDAADCVVAANASGLAAPGQLLEGALTNGGWAWNFTPAPSGASVRYYSGVACESSPSASRSACAAVGATANGPIIATSGSGPGGTWTTRTPSSLPGALVTGIPLETAPATTTTWTTQVNAGQASNAASLPNVLYPQPNGYSIAAGDCQGEALSPAIASLNAPPGGSASTTVPLDLLPLQVVSPLGVPLSGATVKLTSVTAGCAADTYNLPATDAYGVTRSAIPFGTYTYTVTKGGVTTAPTGVTVAAKTASYVTVAKVVGGVTTVFTTFLPQSVVVTSS
jgi:Tfp pilus assembly protein PilV